MATDIQYARLLAERLNAEFTGRIASVEFSFDAYKQTEDIDATAWAVISPLTLSESRDAHQLWTSNFVLLITMLVKQAVNVTSDVFIEENLASFDQLLDFVKNDSKVNAIDREFRYDPDQIQTRATVLARAEVTFNYFD